MSQNIDKIFYINLEIRPDRKLEIENELTNFGLMDKVERFNAFFTANGIVGCTKSHLEVIKLAKERKYKNVLILEDDFYFVISKEEFENQLTNFFNEKISYDVCMISYNLKQSEKTNYPFLNKVIEAQTASGYLINESFYDKLITLYEWALPLLDNTGQHWNYANDQCWKYLQPTSNWYCFSKRFGKQRRGYSNNSNCYQDYDC